MRKGPKVGYPIGGEGSHSFLRVRRGKDFYDGGEGFVRGHDFGVTGSKVKEISRMELVLKDDFFCKERKLG